MTTTFEDEVQNIQQATRLLGPLLGPDLHEEFGHQVDRLIESAYARIPSPDNDLIDLKMATYIVLANGNDAAEAELAAYDLICDMARKFSITLPSHAAALATLDKAASN